VNRQGFQGIADESKKTRFKEHNLFNFADIRAGVIRSAAEKFGYPESRIELRFYVGKFQNAEERTLIADHLGKIIAGRGPVKVIDLGGILPALLKVAESKTYFNDPVVMTLKALRHAGLLRTAPERLILGQKRQRND
jgi:hypothetical protein